jgi:hypothetical protein
VFNFVQVQGQFHITVELDSRQAARKGDPAGLRESQREDLARMLHCVQPQEYIEYFEDSADGCAQALEKRHCVRNLSLTQ